MVFLAKSCNKLQLICVSSDCYLTSDTIHAIATHCSDLRFLSLTNGELITETDWIKVIEKCPNLTHLRLTDEVDITNILCTALRGGVKSVRFTCGTVDEDKDDPEGRSFLKFDRYIKQFIHQCIL